MYNRPDIKRIALSTPFPVGDVYCYLIRDEKTVLVDCGPKSEESLGMLVRALDEEGVQLHDLDELWLTHGHADHFGWAANLQREQGVRLFAHRREAFNFFHGRDLPYYRRFFESSGVPEPLILAMERQKRWYESWYDEISEFVPVDEGDRLETGQLTFQVMHTPGHSPGHLAFLDRESGDALSADVLLAEVSSNAVIAFEPDRHAERIDALAELRHSMKRMGDLDGRMMPGHGPVIANPRRVSRMHLDMQEKRYRFILQCLGDKPASLYEVTLQVFPQAWRKQNAFLALSEVAGYLDWAVTEGDAQRMEEAGSVAYVRG